MLCDNIYLVTIAKAAKLAYWLLCIQGLLDHRNGIVDNTDSCKIIFEQVIETSAHLTRSGVCDGVSIV